MSSKNNFITIKKDTIQNIHPIKLTNEDEYLSALTNLQMSLTGRLDIMFVNIFINETIQLITNGIVLFEKGYFDAAFYSLRESLEISTTAVFFVDDIEENRREAIKNWKNQGKFPGQKQMVKELKSRSGSFSDIREKMPTYFENIESVKRKLDKYVHKQGFGKFYVVRNNPLKFNSYPEGDLIKNFEDFLVKSIGAAAVLRLAIDPFPVLLLDDDIYNRTGQFLTEGYGYNFIQKYIGEKYLEEYKKTDIYLGHYNALIKNEEMLPSVVNLVKDQYIDNNKVEEILSQKHLLSINDLVAITLVAHSSKVVKVYCIGGLSWYFTNHNTNRKKMSWNSLDFTPEKIKENTPYDEAFLTHFKVLDEDYYVEHNDKFNQKELSLLNCETARLDIELTKLNRGLEKKYNKSIDIHVPSHKLHINKI